MEGRPDADECLPYYLAGLSPEPARRREARGEWNAVEIVGHLADIRRQHGA